MQKGIVIGNVVSTRKQEMLVGYKFLEVRIIENNRETDKYNSQGTTSTTALCAIFHSLQAALIEETGYKNEQFAVIHPGGAVGERLNRK